MVCQLSCVSSATGPGQGGRGKGIGRTRDAWGRPRGHQSSCPGALTCVREAKSRGGLGNGKEPSGCGVTSRFKALGCGQVCPQLRSTRLLQAREECCRPDGGRIGSARRARQVPVRPAAGMAERRQRHGIQRRHGKNAVMGTALKGAAALARAPMTGPAERAPARSTDRSDCVARCPDGSTAGVKIRVPIAQEPEPILTEPLNRDLDHLEPAGAVCLCSFASSQHWT